MNQRFQPALRDRHIGIRYHAFGGCHRARIASRHTKLDKLCQQGPAAGTAGHPGTGRNRRPNLRRQRPPQGSEQSAARSEQRDRVSRGPRRLKNRNSRETQRAGREVVEKTVIAKNTPLARSKRVYRHRLIRRQ